MAWSKNMLVAEAQIWCEVTEKMIIAWFQFFRDVCSNELLANPIQIGGPGVVIQIDEILMTKWKDHRGRTVQQHLGLPWILPRHKEGISHPSTKEKFFLVTI